MRQSAVVLVNLARRREPAGCNLFMFTRRLNSSRIGFLNSGCSAAAIARRSKRLVLRRLCLARAFSLIWLSSQRLLVMEGL